MTARLLFAAGVLAVAGVAGASLAQTGAPAAPASQPPAASDGADRALFEKTCAGCHTLDQVVSQQHDTAEWHDLVQQMIGYGATPSAEESDRIVRYLAAHYGKGGQAGAPAS